MAKKQVSFLLHEENIDYIKKNALSGQSFGAYLDDLVQKQRIKSVTMEEINKKLDSLLASFTKS